LIATCSATFIANVVLRGALVEVAEAARHAGDRRLLLVERLDAIDRLGQQVLDVREVAPTATAVGDVEHLLLGEIEQVRAIAPLGHVGAVGDLGADVGQLAQHRALAHDVGVGLDVGRARRVLGQVAEVGQAAGVVEFAGRVEALGKGHRVARFGALDQRLDGAEDQPVIAAVEVLLAERAGEAIPAGVVEQQPTEHGLLGLDRVGWDLERVE
jgi:hypothetical protein